MASVAPSSLTLSSASTSFRYQQDLCCPPSFKTQKSFPNLFLCPLTLKSRERNLIKWADATSKQHSNSCSLRVVVSAISAQAEVAESAEDEDEDEDGSGGVATAPQPQTKPKKGKAALPSRKDRVYLILFFQLFLFFIL